MNIKKKKSFLRHLTGKFVLKIILTPKICVLIQTWHYEHTKMIAYAIAIYTIKRYDILSNIEPCIPICQKKKKD